MGVADSNDSDPRWQRVQAALERYLVARSGGEPIELLAACDGDDELAHDVRKTLDQAGGLLDDAPAASTAELGSFGDFEVSRLIGRGGMGSVYLARQRSLGRMVALKVLNRGGLEVPATRMRLKREAELTALLDHPNIVPIYAVGEVDGVPFLAMKRLSGPSLADVARPLEPERVGRIGRDLARALDAAHTLGIVHRDVKPANVLLDGATPVLVDFGLARGQSDPTLTQEGKVAGTLRYMAPERLDAKNDVVDPRIDVYGLGALLYELLGVREVFGDATPTALVRAILTRDPAPLRLRGRHFDLETIVRRALAKEPSRRFPTAAALADDLDRYLAGEAVHSRRLSWWQRAGRHTARYPRTAAAVAASLLLAAVLSVAMIWRAERTNADRTRRLEQARTDLASGRHARADTTLALLLSAHPDDAEVRELAARARAEVALDDLLVMVTDRSSNIDAQQLVRLQETAVAAGPEARVPLAIACALVAGHRDGPAAAIAAFQTSQRDAWHSRAATALSLWAKNTPPPWTLPETTPAASEEALLTALMLRLSGHPPRTVLAELRRSPHASNRSRTLLLEAIAESEAGDLAVAESALRALSDPESRPTVWRWLGYVQQQLGKRPEAELALSHADASPAADYIRLVQRFSGLDANAAAAELSAWQARAGRSDEVERFLCEHEAKSDPARVGSVLERLRALGERQAYDRIGRDLTVSAMVEVAAWHLPMPYDTAAPDLSLHHSFLERWSEPAASLRHAPAAASAKAWLARSMCLCGREALLPGLDQFEESCQQLPLRPRIAIDYADAVAGMGDHVDPLVRSHHLHAARRVLGRIEDAITTGTLIVATDTRRWIEFHAWQLARKAEDVLDVARRTPGVRSILPDDMLPEASSAEEQAARMRPRARLR
jgi:predicted Ser/Thr protein kinase